MNISAPYSKSYHSDTNFSNHLGLYHLPRQGIFPGSPKHAIREIVLGYRMKPHNKAVVHNLANRDLLMGIDRLNFNIRWLLAAEGDILRVEDVESRTRLAPGTFDLVE